jgi:hypothetical protein
MAESGKCERALEIARLRETGWQRPFVVKSVYKTLRLAGDQSSGKVFQELHERLLQIDTYMAARDEAMKSVIEDLLEFGDNDAAVELLSEMSTDSYSSVTSEAACMIARSVALSGDFRRALALLEFRESRLPEFIGTISTWAHALEHVEEGLRVQYTVLSVAGLKGTMSVLMAASATKLPVVNCSAACLWASSGENGTGEVLFHPDEAVTGAIRAVFERLAEFGSARRVWLWFRSEGLSFPLQITPAGLPGPVRWVAPTYTAIHHILTTRCMLALTRTARPGTNATSMNTAPSENAFGICPWISGRFSFRVIIPASSIGRPFWRAS